MKMHPLPFASEISSDYVFTSDSDNDNSNEQESYPEIDPNDQPQVSINLDEHSAASGEVDGIFEGPEKTLEVCFRRKDGQDEEEFKGKRTALRTLSREDLDLVCEKARCTILSRVSNQYLDAYVLSESSLFVYNYMLVLKTCGTTTLLRCLALLVELGRRLGLELDWVGYSRKNFNFPLAQQFPHGSFDQELEYLYSHRKLCQKLDGNGYTLGPITSDHWFVFVADKTIRSPYCDNDRVLNIMMFDIDYDVADLFYYKRYDSTKSKDETDADVVKRISNEQTKAAGIDCLCPGALLDARAFEPCGYSMNAILDQSYYTIHITPERGSSYASFETNQKLTSYTDVIRNVVSAFRPKRFIMTLMADEGGLEEIKDNPLMSPTSYISIPESTTMNKGTTGYKRRNLASIQVEDDCCCMMGKWIMDIR